MEPVPACKSRLHPRWQEAGRIPLSLDGLSSVGTVWQLYELKGN